MHSSESLSALAYWSIEKLYTIGQDDFIGQKNTSDPEEPYLSYLLLDSDSFSVVLPIRSEYSTAQSVIWLLRPQHKKRPIVPRQLPHRNISHLPASFLWKK